MRKPNYKNKKSEQILCHFEEISYNCIERRKYALKP